VPPIRIPAARAGEAMNQAAALLDDVAGLLAAGSADDVLHAAAETACRLTSSRRSLGGRCEQDAVVSEAAFEAEAGWTPESRRWPAGTGPATVCAGPPLLVLDDADAVGLGVYAAAGALTGEAGLPLGLLAVGRDDTPYAAGELEALAALCRLTAQRLRSCAERPCVVEDCAAQAEIADRLQRRLLPSGPPQLEGVDVAFSYRSASVGVLSGGDFLDFYSRSPSTLAFAIGDVAGKGVDAMAVTFVTKYVLRAAVLGGQLSWPTHPGEALQELRTALLEQPDFGDDPERFVTVLFGTLNTPRGLLQMASAGHPTPFLVRAGGVERPLLLTEPAVGVELGAALAPYPTESVDLRRGDVVVLFTDGLAEMRDVHGEFFEDHMAAALRDCHDRPAEEVVGRLLAAGRRFSAGVPADDVAVLCIRVTGGPVD
jgi:phosphoserine phosphatase RsbU/P